MLYNQTSSSCNLLKVVFCHFLRVRFDQEGADRQVVERASFVGSSLPAFKRYSLQFFHVVSLSASCYLSPRSSSMESRNAGNKPEQPSETDKIGTSLYLGEVGLSLIEVSELTCFMISTELYQTYQVLSWLP